MMVVLSQSQSLGWFITQKIQLNTADAMWYRLHKREEETF